MSSDQQQSRFNVTAIRKGQYNADCSVLVNALDDIPLDDSSSSSVNSDNSEHNSEIDNFEPNLLDLDVEYPEGQAPYLMSGEGDEDSESYEIIDYDTSLVGHDLLDSTPDFTQDIRDLFHIAMTNDPKRYKELMEHSQLHPDAEDSVGHTPFLVAANSGHVEIMRVLIEDGCNPLHRTRNGNSAFMLAAASGKLKSLQFLFEQVVPHLQPSDLEIVLTNRNHDSILMFALMAGKVECAKYLLYLSMVIGALGSIGSGPSRTHPLSLFFINRDGLTPLMCACEGNNFELVDFLMQSIKFAFDDSFDPESLFTQEQLKQYEDYKEDEDDRTQLKEKLSTGYNTTLSSNTSRTAASSSSSSSSQQQPTTAQTAESQGGKRSTRQHPQSDIMTYINCADINGNTALHIAAKDESNSDILLLLLDNKADACIRNRENKTAYDLTRNKNTPAALKMLEAIRLRDHEADEALKALLEEVGVNKKKQRKKQKQQVEPQPQSRSSRKKGKSTPSALEPSPVVSEARDALEIDDDNNGADIDVDDIDENTDDIVPSQPLKTPAEKEKTNEDPHREEKVEQKKDGNGTDKSTSNHDVSSLDSSPQAENPPNDSGWTQVNPKGQRSKQPAPATSVAVKDKDKKDKKEKDDKEKEKEKPRSKGNADSKSSRQQPSTAGSAPVTVVAGANKKSEKPVVPPQTKPMAAKEKEQPDTTTSTQGKSQWPSATTTAASGQQPSQVKDHPVKPTANPLSTQVTPPATQSVHPQQPQPQDELDSTTEKPLRVQTQKPITVFASSKNTIPSTSSLSETVYTIVKPKFTKSSKHTTPTTNDNSIDIDLSNPAIWTPTPTASLAYPPGVPLAPALNYPYLSGMHGGVPQFQSAPGQGQLSAANRVTATSQLTRYVHKHFPMTQELALTAPHLLGQGLNQLSVEQLECVETTLQDIQAQVRNAKQNQVKQVTLELSQSLSDAHATIHDLTTQLEELRALQNASK